MYYAVPGNIFSALRIFCKIRDGIWTRRTKNQDTAINTFEAPLTQPAHTFDVSRQHSTTDIFLLSGIQIDNNFITIKPSFTCVMN